MRPPLFVLLLLLLSSGCTGDGPRAGESPARPSRAAPGRDEVGGMDLLPLKPGRVGWYRATRSLPAGGEVVREVAIFRAWDREAGIYLESVGLPESLRFVVKHEELYALAGDLDGAGYKLLLRGRRSELEVLETEAGSIQCLRLEHTEGGVVARHWFGVGRGLVGYELEVSGRSALRLELVEDVAQGSPPEGYDRSTPDAFWASYQQAIRRLDVGTLEGMFSAELRARLRGGGDEDVLREELARARLDPKGSQAITQRIRQWMPDLLDVALRPTGPWVETEEGGSAVASAPGELTAWLGNGPQRGEAELRLSRGPDGWRLDGFEPRKPR